MKIGSTLDTHAADAALRTGRTAPGAAPVAPAAASTDQVEVSAAGAQLGQLGGDFDSAKVDAIRTAIQEGRFTVNPERIADQLIADATALLGPRSA
ncbi:MAG TPA: flagellar biosynthesis anti-sigma factor FlgM [Ramlibacter sp.]|jgi:negative regulator of flagellin synthesis FlgM|uniref:flagellar biosynthesis anti-sigma factor FlgM n=1 Tax=Ramlibacter sp. TaxID=1917967 RepID=UPI002D3E1156|nr:flagellar biosynthesis anti-sigma factor FlgM [Ramlibacter sp.]HZY18575.1 flagellar biosynthesis anti-sigma factor FlgM [Ramlibacter sp.]